MNRVAIALTLVTAAACSKKLNSGDFEGRITKRLEEMGLAGAKVDCPDNVEAKVGATFECAIAVGGKTYQLVSKITSVEGSELNMDPQWKQGEAVLSNKMEPAVASQLGEVFGVPATVTCGEPLLFLDAQRNVTCDLSVANTKAKVIVTLDDKLSATGWKLDPPLLGRKKLEELLTPSVREQTAPDVTVTCGQDALVPRPPDGAVMCKIANADASKTGTIKVDVDADLKVQKWEVVP